MPQTVGPRQTLSRRAAEEKGRGRARAALEAKTLGPAVPNSRCGEKWEPQREDRGASGGSLGTMPRYLGTGLRPGPSSGTREALIHLGPENEISDEG